MTTNGGGAQPPTSGGNFAFLRADWPNLFEEARTAEERTLGDPRTSCFYARRTLEQLVSWLYEADPALRRPYRDNLDARLHEPTFKNLVGNDLLTKAELIQRQGNKAVHGSRPVRAKDALNVLLELFHVTYWLGRHYARSDASLPPERFDQGLLPHPDAQPAAQSRAELKRLAETLEKRDAELAEEREKSSTLDAEIAKLRAEVAAAKRANEARPDTHDYDEAHTRELFIDLLLAEAGWTLNGENDREFPVTGMPNQSGRGWVDYVLWGDDGKPLALVEAKRTTHNATAGEEQAKRYANCLEEMFGQRPVIYYTNGYEHWIWDDTMYPQRRVQGFHTKEELELLVQRRTIRRPLTEAIINSEIVERYYQHRAIRRVTETFSDDNQRSALVVMATGAGKTRTTVALVDVLMRHNWAKRVLFLADRVALVKQTVNAFKQHLPDTVTVNLVTEKNTEGRVYVSTYPTMMNLIDSTAGGRQRRFGVGHFDLVVIDEAHRSVFQKYRALFSYFDALLLGLTATPRDEIDRSTYSLFGLESGMPTDAYPLEKAVADNYLVPPKAVTVPLKFPHEGISYDELTAGEQEQWEQLDWNDEGDIPDRVEAAAVNRQLFNTDTVDTALETLMVLGAKVAGGDRLGKTIIFATNQDHAEYIVARFNANYPEHKGNFARAVTYQSEQAQNIIDDFAKPDKAPHIAVSVDMLDTGVDIPEVVNLVFFKTVHSKTKFWQMVGRGTRLCPDLFGPGQHKTAFYIFDFCRNVEFFNAHPEVADGKPAQSLGQRLFEERLNLLEQLDKRLPDGTGDTDDTADQPTTSERGLRRGIADLLHTMVAGMHQDNIEVRPHLHWVRTYADRQAWNDLDADQYAGIGEHLAGLPSSERDDSEEEAKRFDLMVLRLQLCALGAETGFDRLRERVREIAGGLLERTSIPVVNEQRAFLDALAGQEWWHDVTLGMLEQARLKVRGLVRLLPTTRRKTVYTDFADKLGDIDEIEMTGMSDASGQVDMVRFRAKVRDFLRQYENNITLHKLRRNTQLTETDLGQLERMLTESGGFDRETLDHAVDTSHGLGLFVRSLIGLERGAAVEAMSDFLSDTALSSHQIEFVDMVVQRLTQDGAMTAAQLYEPPFTDIAPRGPDVIFPTERLRDLEIVLDDVRARAAAS